MKSSSLRPKACKYCGKSDHTSLMCFDKPRKRLPNKSEKTKQKDLKFNNEWLQANPPVDGTWQCYLKIHPDCPGELTIETLTREHVIPKGRRPDLKYRIDNVKPACFVCNELKGSNTLEELKELGIA